MKNQHRYVIALFSPSYLCLQDQLSSCTGLFVDDQLVGYFRDLVDWVKKAEQAVKRSGAVEGQHIPGYAPAQAAPILRDFAARWERGRSVDP